MLLMKFVPRMLAASIYEIDFDELRAQGIRGIIADLDNTLVGADVADADDRLKELLAALKEKGFQIVIVSNNSRKRVESFVSPLGLPFLFRARKPFKRAFLEAMELMGLRPEETAVIGDQMLTDMFGGNRLGLYTILVQPVSAAADGYWTRFNRKMERRMKARLQKRGIGLGEGGAHDL